MRRSSLCRLLAVTAAIVVGSLVTSIPAFGADTFDPNPVNRTLPAGGSTSVDKTLHLDALPANADIVIAIDTTGSMCGAIADAKADATNLVNAVQAQIPGARFALVDFKDYPPNPTYPPGSFGSAGDYPYRLVTPLTPTAAVFQAGVNTLTCGGGNDLPEAYDRAFYEAVNDPALLYNPDAVKFLVVLGDNIPHDPVQQTTFSACPNTPANTVDPGRDTLEGTSDDIHTAAAISGLISGHDTLLMINYGSVLSCYSQLATATGGTAVNSGGNLSTTIVNQIKAAAAHIDSVQLVVSAGCLLNITFNPPPPYGPLTAPVDIHFTETITAPTVPGLYSCSVTAVVDGTARAIQHINVTVVPGPPASLTLAPKTDTNTVDAQHCVTATVKDQFGNPTPGITVRFSVTGAVNTSGSKTTNASGQAEFCYTGPGLPGADVITAYADTNGDNVRQPNEPSDRASKLWVLPASTPGCKVTYGGRIQAANGDKATFGGNAKATGLQGEEEYQDHGAAADLNVHSLNVLAVVCSADGKSASIFGKATVNGSGSFDYRIDVTDNAEPGAGTDTYRIRLSNGYDSGPQVLAGGNIQLH